MIRHRRELVPERAIGRLVLWFGANVLVAVLLARAFLWWAGA